MSDTSLLSSRYQRLADLTERLNLAMLTLKKQRALATPSLAQQYPISSIAVDTLTEAKVLISWFLVEVEKLLRDDGTATSAEQDYAERLHERVVTEDAVAEIRQTLTTSFILNERQLDLLDLLLYLLDDERTTLFRQLRTGRRG